MTTSKIIKISIGVLAVLSIVIWLFVYLDSKHANGSSSSVNTNEQFFSEVKIGTQIWMRRNLDLDKFRNGEPILQVNSEEEWETACDLEKPAWCYYGNDISNGEKYGKLYNWYAVNDPRGLAPFGWRIPEIGDLENLKAFFSTGFGQIDLDGLCYPTEGENRCVFCAMPAGSIGAEGEFHSKNSKGFIWSATSYATSKAHAFSFPKSPAINVVWVGVEKYSRCCGFSVRCIKE